MLSKKKPISKGHILQEGIPKHWNLFIKNCVFVLTCLNFSHLQSTLHLMQYTYRNIFSTAQNSFWTHQFWCLLVLLSVFFFFMFVSPLPHRQNISLWGLFSSGDTQKNSLRVTEWTARVGHRCQAVFWSKSAEHSA